MKSQAYLPKIRKRLGQAGFSMPELLIAATVLLIACAGMTLAYVRCVQLNKLSQDTFTALSQTKSKMEEIKNGIQVAVEDAAVDINNVIAQYDRVAFNPVAGINRRGVSYIDDSDPDLLEVTVTFCWREPNGRFIGEDLDLDGQIDAGEDTNGNGVLDSMVQLTNYIYTK